MARVLQQQKGWSEQFEYKVNHDFKNLRDGVNHTGSAEKTDFFMWEHFTSKKYYDNGEIKRIGEIYTPWPSWIIAARPEVLDETKAIKAFVESVNEGIAYFESHQEEAIEYIYTNLDYSKEDAESWLKTVTFSQNVGYIDPAIIDKTVRVLKPAANLSEGVEKLSYTHNL